MNHTTHRFFGRFFSRVFSRVFRLGLSLAATTAIVGCTAVPDQDLISIAEILALDVPDPLARIPYGTEELQFGNLRLPEGPGPHPVVAFIHGGCWLSQFDITHAAPLEQALADAGYAVWSLEYRRVGNDGGGWPGTFTDVARGIDHLRELATEFPLDLSRVVASGHSAGGQLALWAAARARIPSSSEVFTESPLAIQGVLALAPAPDLESLHEAEVCGGVVDQLMGGSPRSVEDRYNVGSPMRLWPIGIPERLIIGAHDASWGPGGRAYFEKAQAEGRSLVSMREAPDAGHFEVIAPNSSTWAVVLEEMEAVLGQIGGS